MAERPAVNASPLIFLSRAGFLHLLQLVSQETVVPETVAMEIGLAAQVIQRHER